MSVRVENMRMKEVKMVSEAERKFSRSLYTELKKEEGNILFSPYGVTAVLAMLCEGARGETREMMRRVMFLPDQDTVKRGYSDLIPSLKTDFTLILLHNEDSFRRDREFRTNEGITLETATAGFVMRGYKLEAEFQGVLRSFFKTGMKELDFQNSTNAARAINDWVKSQTKDKIEEIVTPDSLDINTKLLLVNAIYFKGVWASPFDKDRTRPAAFWVTDQESREVQMMTRTSELLYARLEELDCSVVELPYGNGRLVMQVLVPDQRLGVTQLEEKMADIDLSFEFGKKHQVVTVEFSLPRFTLSTDLSLTDSLHRMGMENLFSAEETDLSGITGSRLLYVSGVKQRGVIQVDEEGSEASVVTSVTTTDSATAPKIITVDHPFIFLISDTLTGSVLFQGRVVNPSDPAV